MSSVAEDAEKLWGAITRHDVARIKEVLGGKPEDTVKEILERQTNTIILTKHSNQRDGLSCLHLAAKKGHGDVLKLLFRFAGDADVNTELLSDPLGWRPLHYAVFSGHVTVVKTLIREGADVDATENRGYSPLHVAIERGHRKMVAVLVHEQCNVNAQDNDKSTPLHLCFLAEHGWNAKELSEVVDYLLQKGAAYNIMNSDGDLPIHTAVKQDAHKESIEVLCTKMNEHDGIAFPNSQGKIPLHLSKSMPVSEVLIEYGGSINKQDEDGLTLLHLRSDDVAIVQALLDKGSDTSVKDKKGRLPIHYAVLQTIPDVEAVKLLGESLDNVNVQDEAGDSPLHLVCDNNYAKLWVRVEKSGKTKRQLKSVDSKPDPIVSWLISKGADSNLQNHKQETALHRALKHKSTSKAELLARAGADPMLQDDTGAAAKKLNARWFNKMDREGTFISLNQSHASLSTSPPPRESWFRKLSREATSLFTPRIHLEETQTSKKQDGDLKSSSSSDWLGGSASTNQKRASLQPPADRPGTPSSSSIIAAPPPSIRFNAGGRTKTQLGAFRMKREQTLLKQSNNGPMKALPPSNTLNNTSKDTVKETQVTVKDTGQGTPRSTGKVITYRTTPNTSNKSKPSTNHFNQSQAVSGKPTDSQSESLQRQLTSLHSEMSGVKDLLEELSSEGEPRAASPPSQPQTLERQLSSLHDEVNEVKQMLEELDADRTV